MDLDYVTGWLPEALADYRLPIGMVLILAANVLVLGGFGLLMTAAPYWLTEYRVRQGRRIDMFISVIVTTFDRPNYLSAVLRSLSRQTDRHNFEIVIADDGSGPDTARVIAGFERDLGWRLRHVWQPHDGFRAAEIRNRAVAESHGNYLVFIDGDCLAPRDFVARHRRLAAKGWFVAGKRAFLSKDFTDRVLETGLEPERFGLLRWLRCRLRGDVNRISILASLPIGPLRRLSAGKWKATQTCNLGVWRDDAERVNGFDTRFVGWGLEDSDLVVRLLRSGVRRKSGASAVVHLWHPPESKITPNAHLFDSTIKSDRTRAVVGLSELTA
jgi:glycosyltransferase involved in cell wall biosynthesis